MKAKELRELTPEELRTELRQQEQALFNLRMQLASGQLDDSSKIRKVRRDIARILTVLREKELGIRG